MAVQPDQTQVAGLEDAGDGRHRLAAGQREPELLVLVCGRDELVRVRLDTDGDADQDVLHDAAAGRDLVEALDLDHRVEHDVPDPGRDGGVEFGDGLVVAVHRDPLGGEAGMQCDGQFTRRTRRPSTGPRRAPAGDLGGQEGLRRIVHALGSRRRRAPSRAAAERKSSSSTTNSGVPYFSASSVTGTPAMRTTPSAPRSALRGHTCSGSAVISDAVAGRGGSPGACWISACRGPAGCAFTCAPVR